MATAYLASRMSPHLAHTPDGFLLCKDVVITRSGPLEYRADELDIPGAAGRVMVWRPPEEVTSKRFLASVEGAVVCDSHPSRFVDPNNFQIHSRGHAQNARIGSTDANGNVEILADLFINDQGLAAKVESGAVRDVSIGFDLAIEQDAKGRWLQRNLRVNHIAVVPRGRAGSTRIMDAAPLLGLAEMAALYLGRDPAAVVLPKHATDSSSKGEAMEPDDLIQVEETPAESRDAALHYLRRIKPQVARSGSDDAKRAWNSMFSAIRDGAEPRVALDHAKRLAAGDAAFGGGADAPLAVAADLVRSATQFFGRDIHEVATERRAAQIRDFHLRSAQDSDRTASDDLVAKAEVIADEMRRRKY